jgi:hypothetical protein
VEFQNLVGFRVFVLWENFPGVCFGKILNESTLEKISITYYGWVSKYLVEVLFYVLGKIPTFLFFFSLLMGFFKGKINGCEF